MNLDTLAATLRNAHQKNPNMDIRARIKKLELLKKEILKRESEISDALKIDLGKSAFETYTTEIGFILEEISLSVKNLTEWASVKKVKTPLSLFPGKSTIHPEPYGVVLIISPWNYPFQLCLSPFVGAISAGNRVVIKPSEFAVETAKIIEKIVSAVFTEDDVAVVQGGLEESQILLKQRFDYIFFTGSTAVGKIIMQAASEFLTPVTLELGGKSPCLIEDSANIDIAAKRIVWGKYLNAGQTCVAPDYILVPKRLQDELISKIGEYVTTFYGKDIQASDDYPRIINNRHFDRLQGLVIDSKVAFGGKIKREDNFMGPTIMKDVEWSDKVMQDEIFGPILPIIPYDSLDEAINGIMNYPKPLAFYVFSENRSKQKDIIARVPFGGGCINDTVIHLANPNLPFGGVGTSGIGSYHGKKSFDTFTHYKSLYQQGTLVDIPLRYPPYNDKKLSWIKLFLR
jgi:aldehyde dehydrogenase (NAD+)